MDIVIPTEHFHSSTKCCFRKKPFILSSHNNLTKLKCTSSKKHFGTVFATVSKFKTSGLNGKSQHFGKKPNPIGNSNAIELSSNGSRNLEELENNNHLRKLVKFGELDQGFGFLKRMTSQGDIPDVIACTNLMR